MKGIQFRSIYYSFTPGMRILFILIVSLCIFVLSFLPLYLLGLPLFGIGFKEAALLLQGDISNSHTGFQMYLQAAQSVALFIIPPFAIARLFSYQEFRFLGLKKGTDFTLLVFVILASLAIIPIINVSGVINERLSLPDSLQAVEDWMQAKEGYARDLTIILLKMDSPLDLIRSLLVVALLPAIGEELFFRGLLQPAFKSWFNNTHLAVVITAILFSALHLQFYGFLPRFILGLFFGYLYMWTENILLPILAHLVNNSLAVLLSYANPEWLINDNMDMGSTDNVMFGVLMLSIGFTGVFLLLVRSFGKKETGQGLSD